MAGQATRSERISGSNAANIQRYLKNADYPATPDELVGVAQDNRAPGFILDLIEAMTDKDYHSPIEVQEEIFGATEEVPKQRDRGPVRSRIRGQQLDDPSFEEYEREYEERGGSRRRRMERDPWDHRLQGHETPQLDSARHMRHGYDGRGRVTDDEDDRRLSGNETEELYEARHMTRGYDGRGRVRKHGPGNIDTEKHFEGNERATGGTRRKPLYKMSREEREQLFEEESERRSRWDERHRQRHEDEMDRRRRFHDEHGY